MIRRFFMAWRSGTIRLKSNAAPNKMHDIDTKPKNAPIHISYYRLISHYLYTAQRTENLHELEIGPRTRVNLFEVKAIIVPINFAKKTGYKFDDEKDLLVVAHLGTTNLKDGTDISDAIGWSIDASYECVYSIPIALVLSDNQCVTLYCQEEKSGQLVQKILKYASEREFNGKTIETTNPSKEYITAILSSRRSYRIKSNVFTLGFLYFVGLVLSTSILGPDNSFYFMVSFIPLATLSGFFYYKRHSKVQNLLNMDEKVYLDSELDAHFSTHEPKPHSDPQSFA